MPLHKTSTHYSPVTTNEQWMTEPGFIGSFSNPNPSTLGEAATSGVLGAGAGAVGGALAHKNTWFTGANTGMGSAAGYLLAHTLARNSDPGMQQAYETLGSLLGGGAGFAGSMFMKDKRKHEVKLPGDLHIEAKTASFEDVIRGIHEQLLAVRVPDSVVGGGVGALGGLGYDWFKKRNEKDATKGQKHKDTFRRALVGAGLGAAAGNAVGDRARRYAVNNMSPYGYGENKSDLEPKSLKHIWDSAIADKPQNPEVAKYEHGDYGQPFEGGKDIPFGNSRGNAAARYELSRREFGIHTDNPHKDIWAKQPDGTLSLNPKHKNAPNLVRELMFPQSSWDTSQMLHDPLKSIARINDYHPDERPGMMQEINGGQRIFVSPHEAKGGGTDYQAKILDQQGYAPRSYELKNFQNYLKERFLHGNTDAKVDGGNAYAHGDNPAKQLAKRWFLHNVLMKEHPWISQRMYFHNTPDKSFQAVPTTASGELYPGDTVGYMNGNEPDLMNSSNLK
jgi:hypothetical protein